MTPVVLVHGFMGGSAQWTRQVDALSDHFEVVTPDLPGFGRNAHLPVIDSIPGFADWVIEDLRARDINQYHLMGHSMGGMIAQEIARRDAKAVQKLILYGTGAVGVLPGRFETIAQSKLRAAQDGTGPTARRISATWFTRGKNDPAYEGCAQIAEQSNPAAIPAGLDAMQAWSGKDGLPGLSQDTLVIWGDGDRTYGWPQIQQLCSDIPRTRLSLVPGCAHAVHLEKPQAFNDIILEFLAGHRPARAFDGTDLRKPY